MNTTHQERHDTALTTTITTNMVAHQQHSTGSINRSVVPRNFKVPRHIVPDPEVDQIQNNDRVPSECDLSKQQPQQHVCITKGIIGVC